MQVETRKAHASNPKHRLSHNTVGSPFVLTASSVRRKISPVPPPSYWKQASVNSECTLHQLSPYIGKLKSSIARDLIITYSKPGELVIDPFSGSGTVPLEAAILGRNVFAADISPYSKILTKAKIFPPPGPDDALKLAGKVLKQAEKLPEPDLEEVPEWVRKFFHPETLKDALRFAGVCRRNGCEFLMACFLGILHHQRPGFLSYPSSHLVPYLRDKKYPPHKFPELYEYRPLRPRLLAKIKRAYRRKDDFSSNFGWEFRQSKIENLTFPGSFDCLITSPPYMNTLDYGRDNRLRLWFIDPRESRPTDNPVTREKKAFHHAIACMAKKVEKHLKKHGYCILIVGERVNRSNTEHLSKDICRIMSEKAPSLRLISIIEDEIPDIRRTRKNCLATKTEHILIYKRLKNA
jgi:hypothetical protein